MNLNGTEERFRLYAVGVVLCAACISGQGGECHTPGCALWMSQAPDQPMTVEHMKPAP